MAWHAQRVEINVGENERARVKTVGGITNKEVNPHTLTCTVIIMKEKMFSLSNSLNLTRNC